MATPTASRSAFAVAAAILLTAVMVFLCFSTGHVRYTHMFASVRLGSRQHSHTSMESSIRDVAQWASRSRSYHHAPGAAGGRVSNASATDMFGLSSSSTSDCPGWFQDYVAFHQEYRSRPDAKYLVAECSLAGLGDRLNGALIVLKTAAALRRVVLLKMPAPFPLEEFFEPAGPVNWTIGGLTLPQNGTR